MRTSLRLALATPLLSLLAACGGGADASGDPYDRGLDQAKAGDHAAAVASYDAALDGMGTDDAQYKEVLMAKIESMTHTNAADATIAFLEYADGNREGVAPADYAKVFNWLVAVKDFGQGGKLASELKAAYPDNETEATAMDDRIKAALAAGEVSAEEREMLEGLGYL